MERAIRRREGYWKTSGDSLLPNPVARDKPWLCKTASLPPMEAVQKEAHASVWKGVSTCRLCGGRNGAADYALNGWQWPSGFYHYVEAHNMRPV